MLHGVACLTAQCTPLALQVLGAVAAEMASDVFVPVAALGAKLQPQALQLDALPVSACGVWQDHCTGHAPCSNNEQSIHDGPCPA